jgi:hypothetical protein
MPSTARDRHGSRTWGATRTTFLADRSSRWMRRMLGGGFVRLHPLEHVDDGSQPGPVRDRLDARANRARRCRQTQPPAAPLLPCDSPKVKVVLNLVLPVDAPSGIAGPGTPAGLVSVSPDFNSTPPGPINRHTGKIDFCYGGPVTVTLTEQPENGWVPMGWQLASAQRFTCAQTRQEGGPTCTITVSARAIAVGPPPHVGVEAVADFCSPIDAADHDPRCLSAGVG